MTEAQAAVWRFAVANPDYWPLLRTDDATPELVALSSDDREAFDAARRVAQERAVRLLRRCWDDLGERAKGTRLYDFMADRPQRASILNNKMGSWLPDNKGSITLAIWNSRGSLSLWATMSVAKKRIANAQTAWQDGASTLVEENRLMVRHTIQPDASDEEVSAAFTADYWPRLARWLGYEEVPNGAPSAEDESE
jgi:hypothetical protein